MRHLTLLAASLALLAPVLPPAAHADPAERLVVVESKLGVKETIDALAREVEAKGLKIIARVDHAAGAKAAGMELKPTELLIFGNPKLGTPLIAANPAIGIDLPLKALAWQDASGKVMLGYTAPATMKARHGITGQDGAFETMTKALAGLAAAATGPAK